MKNNITYHFDGKFDTSAAVQVLKSGSVAVILCVSKEAVWTVNYTENELDMALALAEYYTRKVNPEQPLYDLTERYPMLRLYSHLNAYSKRRQRKIGSRWSNCYYCEQTRYGLKPLYNPKHG